MIHCRKTNQKGDKEMTKRTLSLINDKNNELLVQFENDKNDYLIIKDEQYRPDKSEFVFNRFLMDFPHLVQVRDVQMVYSLASRQNNLAEWLAKVNLDYALQQNEPTFYRDHVDPKEYETISGDIQETSIRNRNRANEEVAAALEYKSKMANIAKKYDKFNYKSKYSRIILMNTTELPLTLQIAIDSYNPAEDPDLVSQKTYAREMLVQYKLALINYLKQNPQVDIDSLIKSYLTK
jgi:hypothetical protein